MYVSSTGDILSKNLTYGRQWLSQHVRKIALLQQQQFGIRSNLSNPEESLVLKACPICNTYLFSRLYKSDPKNFLVFRATKSDLENLLVFKDLWVQPRTPPSS